MGGDLIALGGNAAIFTIALVLIETGSFMFIARFCKSKVKKEIENKDLESNDDRFEPDVIREAERVKSAGFSGLMKIVNLRKEYNQLQNKIFCCKRKENKLQ